MILPSPLQAAKPALLQENNPHSNRNSSSLGVGRLSICLMLAYHERAKLLTAYCMQCCFKLTKTLESHPDDAKQTYILVPEVCKGPAQAMHNNCIFLAPALVIC